VAELGSTGVVVDGVPLKDADREGFKRAVFDRWGRELILRVAPDVAAASVYRVLMHARVAKLSVVRTTSGDFDRELWTHFTHDDGEKGVLMFHVVGGDTVRFQRFGVPASATTPGALETFDWVVSDERSGESLAQWATKNSRPRDLVVAVMPNALPFGEAARVVKRLETIWKDAPSIRLGIAAVEVALDAPLEQRFAALSIPQPVVSASMKFVDPALARCYATARDRDTKEKGIFVVKLTIDASGAVAAVPDAETTIEDPKTLACMLAEIRRVRFPRREGAAPFETKTGFFYRSH
jgi:hypothetical protein